MKLSAGTSRMVNRWQCASMTRCWPAGENGPAGAGWGTACPGATAAARLPAMKSRRRIAASSVGVFVEHRLDRALPRPVILLEQLLGRRDAAREELLQRPQITGLVAPVVVEPRTPLQAGFR